MQTNQIGMQGWRQIDAGLWVKPATAGHVEITFASDADGSPLYEVSAFDIYGQPTELPFAAREFEMFETALGIGDLLSFSTIEMTSRGH